MVCGDTGDAAAPGISTHLEITNLKIPMLEINYVDVTPGGAPVQIEVPMFMNKLEATFTLAGWNPAVMAMIGQTARALQRFTAYGLIRDRRTSAALKSVAMFECQLGRVNPTEFRKNNLQEFEYALHSIVHFELYMQEQAGVEPAEIYFWDFFTSDFRIGRVNVNTDLNAILAIPGAAV